MISLSRRSSACRWILAAAAIGALWAPGIQAAGELDFSSSTDGTKTAPPSPPPPPPPPERTPSCYDQHTESEQNGIVSIHLSNPCRKNQSLALTYELEVNGAERTQDRYVAAFDSTGQAGLKISLFQLDNRITFKSLDGKDQEIKATYSGAMSDVKIALLWELPVRLDLHVVEPGGKLGTDDVWSGRPNDQLRNGLGAIDLWQDGDGQGRHIQDYRLRSSALPSHGELDARVDYASRGNMPNGDYCGAGRYAEVEFFLRVLVEGKLQQRPSKLGALTCGDTKFERLAFSNHVRLPQRVAPDTFAQDFSGRISVNAATIGPVPAGAGRSADMAELRADGTIDLYLDEIDANGAHLTGHLVYPAASADYAKIAESVGPLKPGERHRVKLAAGLPLPR